MAHFIILLNNTGLNNQEVTCSLPFSTHIGLFAVPQFTLAMSSRCVDYSLFLEDPLLDILMVSFLTFFCSLLNLSERTSLTSEFKMASSNTSTHPPSLFFQNTYTWHIICRCVCVYNLYLEYNPHEIKGFVLFTVSLE